MSEPTSANPSRLDRRVKHGMYGHPLYKTWDGMISRCERQSDPYYHCYGGRGIRVCERWHDPRHFVADIMSDLGPRPAGRTLDRINNEGDYEPGNVRWATAQEQALNKRPDTGRSARATHRLLSRPFRTETCEQCGAEYETRALAGTELLRFCSKKCKAKHRRDSGVDDVERACHQCEGTFTCNRYDKTRHCSLSCSATCQHAGGCPR